MALDVVDVDVVLLHGVLPVGDRFDVCNVAATHAVEDTFKIPCAVAVVGVVANDS